MKTIVLGIDGVVHPNDAVDDIRVRDDGRLEFLGSELFAWNSVLENLVVGNSVPIVIHSSWRRYYRLNELQNYFPQSVRQQVVAVTEGSGRFDAIQRYVAHYPEIEDFGFIVVDDMADVFPKDWPYLIVCDGAKGISCRNVHMSGQCRFLLLECRLF